MKERDQRPKRLSGGHLDRFEARLDQELHGGRESGSKWGWQWIGMAATLIFLVGLAFIFQQGDDEVSEEVVVQQNSQEDEHGISLGDLSPELQQIETYYVANINLELAELPAGSEHKLLVDGYMERLATLNEAYKALQLELNEDGPNNQVITALIENLQMRLDLLYNLKEQLHQLNSSNHEIEQTI